MNNKAFSLIELLAVIVILAILGTISTIAYNSVVENSRIKAYKRYEDTMKSAAEMYIINNGVPSESQITVNDLLNGNYLDKFTDPKSSSTCPTSYVTINQNVSDKTDINYKVCLICPNYTSDGC